MAQYVDGFVLPIPKDKVDFYRSIAEEAAKIWREHGALEYREGNRRGHGCRRKGVISTISGRGCR